MRHTTLLFMMLAGALSVALFSVKYQVQDLEQELIGLNDSIILERQAVHVLKAEWSHLNNSERLERLATRYLGMTQITPEQLSTFDDLPIATASGDGEENQ
ncbi:MAG: hypothetical protein HQ504_06855 [Rhodospirillaceae bacterium]|nr:hypothetical protein [Rhodospirillaceae bacterium]